MLTPFTIYANTAAATKALGEMEVSEADGFRVAELPDGRFAIECFDPEDGFRNGFV